mgnify:CR=1 FL=1
MEYRTLIIIIIILFFIYNFTKKEIYFTKNFKVFNGNTATLVVYDISETDKKNINALQQVRVMKNGIINIQEILIPISNIKLNAPDIKVNNDSSVSFDRTINTLYSLEDMNGYLFFPDILWSSDKLTIYVKPIKRKFYCNKNKTNQDCVDFKNSFCLNTVNNEKNELCINGNYL